MTSSSLGQFTVVPSLPVGRLPSGEMTITRKFLSGMEDYVRRWPGPVAVFMTSAPVGDNLDNERIDPRALPFRLVIDGDLGQEIARSAVVLGSASREQAGMASACRRAGVPCVYVTEYSLRTRLQIVATNTRNPLLRWRRVHWEWRTERIMRRAIRQSAGVQCNGTPTYDAYRGLTPNPLLFFDTRSTADSLATDAQLEARLATLRLGQPLRIVFSGRLIRMKGADHLVEVARQLHQRGVAFRMTICGDGDLSASMRSQIGALPIVMAGVLDFDTELQPFLIGQADLFVCCHRQGDPSCTYLETMAAGVPIVSYDNEAFVGVQRASGVGWSVPMDRPDEMAERIARLPREAIADASRQALAFARQHTFESVFEARIDHLKRIAEARRQDTAGGPSPIA